MGFKDFIKRQAEEMKKRQSPEYLKQQIEVQKLKNELLEEREKMRKKKEDKYKNIKIGWN